MSARMIPWTRDEAMEGTGTLGYEYRDVDSVPGFVDGIEVIGLLPDGTFAECCLG